MSNRKWIKVTAGNKPEEGKDYVFGWYTDTGAWLSVFGFCDDGKIDDGEYTKMRSLQSSKFKFTKPG